MDQQNKHLQYTEAKPANQSKRRIIMENQQNHLQKAEQAKPEDQTKQQAFQPRQTQQQRSHEVNQQTKQN